MKHIPMAICAGLFELFACLCHLAAGIIFFTLVALGAEVETVPNDKN